MKKKNRHGIGVVATWRFAASRAGWASLLLFVLGCSSDTTETAPSTASTAPISYSDFERAPADALGKRLQAIGFFVGSLGDTPPRNGFLAVDEHGDASSSKPFWVEGEPQLSPAAVELLGSRPADEWGWLGTASITGTVERIERIGGGDALVLTDAVVDVAPRAERLIGGVPADPQE